MSIVGQHPDEKRFEAHIEKCLNAAGFRSVHFGEYDRELCLLPDEFLCFIRNSQPEQYQKLTEQYSESTDDVLFKKLSENTGKYGLIHTLRNPLSSRGVHLDTFIKQPRSSLNPEHIDLYKKNRFAVVRQLHFSPDTDESVDICLFLNGIPLLTMELKNQLTGQNIRDAQNQYRSHRSQMEKLFSFRRCLVHFGVDNDNVSMTTRLSGLKTRFLPYNKGIPNPDTDGYRSEYLWKEILTPESLIDIIENFVHVSEEEEKVFSPETQNIHIKKSKVLIFPRYHQLDVVRKLRKQVQKDGVGTNYLIQHTTGAGKSFEIGWLSHALTSLYQRDTDTQRMFDTIIVVTDRKVLDKQLQTTIKSLEQTDGVVKPVDESSAQLKKYLEGGKDIIITTIQKFPFISDTIASLRDRKFGVIIDEVHSSQSGERSKELKKALSGLGADAEDEEDFDYEDYIRKEIRSRGKQPHISFFGFTGTPKEKTLELFGTRGIDDKFYPFHSYTMSQSIHEGFTLDVLQNYTTFKRYFRVREKVGQDIMVPAIKGKRQLIRFVDSHPQTIQSKVGIMLDHFINYASREIQGKSRGMIVVRSRLDCVMYFREVNKQLEERGIPYRALVAFSSSVSNEKYHIHEETEVSLNRTVGHTGDIPSGLKNPKYRLLIVSNKFQTGFDEPLVQSMYVDKRLEGVQCVQTLSRINRTCRGKEKTFVLDFVNEVSDIIESFEKYYTTTLLSGETDPDQLYEYQTEINSYNLFTKNDVEEFCKVFYAQDRDDGSLQPILNKAVEQFTTIEVEQQNKFKSLIQSFMRLYSYVAQIMTFTDAGLEKFYIFLRYLNRKLPKDQSEQLDISDLIDLEALKIQKKYEGNTQLDPGHIGELAPHDFKTAPRKEDEEEFLSELIRLINERFGSNLTEEDKLDLVNLHKRVMADEGLVEFMHGDSSDTNKRQHFNNAIDKILLDYVKDRFAFYKKLDDNPSMKNMIVLEMYRNYHSQQNRSQTQEAGL